MSEMNSATEALSKGGVQTDPLETRAMSEASHEPNTGGSAARLTLPRPQWLPKSVWPFETRGLEVDGSIVAITEVGRGPVLLFVHTGLWSFIWRDVMTRLSADFRCICLDAHGTGQSDRVPKRAITLDTSSRAVTTLIEQLDLQNLTLVVHDLDGLAGLAGAAQTPERVRGIVAINTFGWRPSGVAFRGTLAVMGSALMREIDVATEFLPWLASTAFGAGRHLDEPSRRLPRRCRAPGFAGFSLLPT